MVDGAHIPDYMRLLDAEALGRIGRHEFSARGVVEGFITGHHRSPYKGLSAEFAEHREYAPGDDIRNLDWRVFGRSDRYYIKQYIEETNLRATILLDASGSMRYQGNRAAPRDGRLLTKYEYASRTAALMAHLLINQQDAVGLVTYDTAIRRYIPARSRPSHLRVLLQEMHEAQPGEETDLAPIFHDIAEKVPRRGLILIMSDLFGDADAIIEALHHFRHRKHDVIVFHVMAEEELTFPYDRWSTFFDLEVDENRIQVDPRAIRSAYVAEVEGFIDKIRAGCGQLVIDYVQMTTATPFDLVLANYLSRRHALTAISRGPGMRAAGPS